KLTQVALDNAGNPVIAGENYNGYLDLDPGLNTNEVDGLHRLFYEKLTASGNLVWAKSLTGYSNFDAIFTELLIDASNNIFLSGHFQSIIDFDPGSGAYEFNGNGPADGFIAKYASNGDFSWVRTFFNGTGPVYFNDIDMTSTGKIIATGSYSYTTDFDPDLINTYNLETPSYTPRGFLLQLSNTGIFEWAQNLTSDVESSGIQINCDDNDGIMVAGYFTSTADLDPNPNNTFNVTSTGVQDIFMTKFDQDGAFIYANTMGSTTDDRITAMQRISGTNYYITAGYFENTIDLDPNSSVNTLSSAQIRDTFIALYAECSAQAVTIQDVGCGEYEWNNSFYVESGTYTQTLISQSGCDSIVTLELTIALPTSSNLVQTACDSYTILDQTLTESGNYTLNTLNALGCDSTILLSLTIEPMPSFEISIDGNTMTSSFGDSYQWVECNGEGEYLEIEGANEQSFSPAVSGNYAVLVSSGTCSSYSDCVEFTYIDVNELSPFTINVYPNPANDIIQITAHNLIGNQPFLISDATGRIVLEIYMNANTKTINISSLSPGMYILRSSLGQSLSFIKE
ncbi:MAG: T9SS type A sorting domain-containing protein, partial [Flavobacteriales bacterium]